MTSERQPSPAGRQRYGLNERQTYMLRVQADLNARPDIDRMNRMFIKAWVGACIFLVLLGVVLVNSHPRAYQVGASIAINILVTVLFLAFTVTGAGAVALNYQYRHWLSVRAKALWQEDQRAEAAHHPWPPPSNTIEY